MKVTITIKEVFWAVENCFEQIQSIDFKYHIRKSISDKLAELTETNTDKTEDEINALLKAELIEVEIDNATFLIIMNAVNSQPQGIALDINPPLYDKLKAQIIPLAMSGNVDAIELLTQMQQILVKNAEMLENKIKSGKERILA